MQNLIKRQTLEYIFVATVIIGSFAFLIITPAPKGKVYDCSLSEISPDYPLEVKEECRKLRTKNFQEELKKPK